MEQRVLVDVAATLEWTNVDQDGAAAPAAGAVTVKVDRDDGSAVLPAGTATIGAGDGLYKVALTAAQNDRLDLLKATWTDAGDGSEHVTRHEVVGAYWFTEAQARAADPGFTEAAYPSEVVELAGREVEDAIELQVRQALGKGVSFVSRYRRVVVSGSGLDVVELPDYFVGPVRSVAIADEAAFGAGELADLVAESGHLSSTLRTWTLGRRNIDIAYKHGLDSPPPVIRRAGLLLFKAWLPAFKQTAAAYPGPLRSLSAEGLSLGFSTASGATGVDAVDRLVETWLATPSIASPAIA